MRIRKVRLIGVKAFRLPFERELYDAWNERVPSAVLVHGPNGSGKTTVLEAVAELWDYFGRNLGSGAQIGKERPAGRNGWLGEARFAGVQLEGLFPDLAEPVWLFVSGKSDYSEFQSQLEGVPHLGAVRMGRKREILVSHSSTFVARFAESHEAVLGGRLQDFPNVVWIGSEGRALGLRPKKIVIPTGKSERAWIARYDPRDLDVGSLLYDLKFNDAAAFERVVENVNRFLIAKKITTFNPDSVLQVESTLGKGIPYTIYDLGSGEKQVLVLLAFVDRWLRRGGALLIDEPDLHLHVSVTRQLVDALEKIVKERDGQMLLTSHSPEVWEGFPREVERMDLGAAMKGSESPRNAGGGE
jgi:ABC-type lipoprotein export system ATPase subunit